MKKSKVKNYLNTKSMNDDIQKHERDGWEVVNVNTTVSPVIDHNYEIEWTLLYQRDADQSQQAAGSISSIISFERVQTHSNSRNQDFDFWRCELSNGETVRLFDHPDESRNDFLKAAQGWKDYLRDCTPQTHVVWPTQEPIPVTVQQDGKWLRLTQMLPFEQYRPALLPGPDATESDDS
jgi:hypothetical protein